VAKAAGVSYAAARRLVKPLRRDKTGRLKSRKAIVASAKEETVAFEVIVNYSDLYDYFLTAGEKHHTIEVALPFYQTEEPITFDDVPTALDMYREIGELMDEEFGGELAGEPKEIEKHKAYRAWRVEYQFRWIFENGMIALTEGPQDA
jgi:hypothetical protein